MAVISSAPNEIINAFGALGPQAPANIKLIMNNDGSTVGFFNGPERVNAWLNAQGAGVAMMCSNPAGPGDGKKMAPGRRFTKSFLAGTADASQETTMKMSTAAGTSLTMRDGGGAKATILLATGDGQNGLLITDGYVALYSKGVEIVVRGNEGKITFTYALVKEPERGSGVNKVHTYSTQA